MAKKAPTKKRPTVVPFKVPSPRLSRYLYVEARGWFDNITDEHGDIRQVLEEPLSFDSVTVQAKSESDALNVGVAALDTRRAADPTHAFNHASGAFLNDYVVKL